MDTRFKQLTRFIQDIGAADLQHSGEKSYLAHVISVYNDLKSWGADVGLCHAGLFHSIYGTELFQRFTLPLDRRADIRALIGDRAERLAYWNCAMDRASLDASVIDGQSTSVVDRITGERCDLDGQDFTDLMTLHLCDWLEQVPRTRNWDYRRPAYRAMAERLGGAALSSYDRVFAQEKPKEVHLTESVK